MWSIRKQGFSLVELVVVMGVMAILTTSVVLVNVTKNLAKGRDSRRQADLEGLRSALEQYRYDNSKYISTAGGDIGAVLTSLVPDYVGALPVEPSAGENYYYVSPTGTPGIYQLCARVEISPVPTPVACGGGKSCGTGTCNYQVANP